MYKKVVIAAIVCFINVTTFCMESKPQSLIELFLPEASAIKEYPQELLTRHVFDSFENKQWWYLTKKWFINDPTGEGRIDHVKLTNNGQTIAYAEKYTNGSRLVIRNNNPEESTLSYPIDEPMRNDHITDMHIDQSGKRPVFLCKSGRIGDVSEGIFFMSPKISSGNSCLGLSADGKYTAYLPKRSPNTLTIVNSGYYINGIQSSYNHTCEIKLIKFNHDSSKIVFIDKNEIITVITFNGQKLWAFTPPNKEDEIKTEVSTLLFSSDSKHLFCAFDDETIRTFDAETGAEVSCFTCEDTPWRLFLNNKNELVAWYMPPSDDHGRLYLNTVNTTTGITTELFCTDSLCKNTMDSCCVEINNTEDEIVLENWDTIYLLKQYTTPTRDQILLRTILRRWLLIEKPQRSTTRESLYQSISTLFNVNQNEISAVWCSFPEYMQQAIWDNMQRLIQKYGK